MASDTETNNEVTGYLAPEGFERELIEELGSSVVETHERLVLAKTAPVRPSWAQDVWHEPRKIDIASISDGAKKLRSIAPRWALYSTTLHRRAGLIQEALPKLKKSAIGFLSPVPEKPLGSWTLLSNETILASPRSESVFPLGEVEFEPDREAPSRAYLKLWELFTVHGVRPKPGERCLDLGASPGGWTWVLARMGCQVTAVDRSPLDAKFDGMKNVAFIQHNAFTLAPAKVGAIDWLFSDIICFPTQLETLIKTWMESGLAKNFVCTIKFKGATDHATTARLAAIPGAHVTHLFHNKHELTWWLVRR